MLESKLELAVSLPASYLEHWRCLIIPAFNCRFPKRWVRCCVCVEAKEASSFSGLFWDFSFFSDHWLIIAPNVLVRMGMGGGWGARGFDRAKELFAIRPADDAKRRRSLVEGLSAEDERVGILDAAGAANLNRGGTSGAPRPVRGRRVHCGSVFAADANVATWWNPGSGVAFRDERPKHDTCLS